MSPFKSKSILIGSAAAQKWFPDFRKPKDTDYLVNGNWSQTMTRQFEFHDARKGEGLTWIYENSDGVASPEVLYTLKLSHSFWNINWEKTVHDIAYFQAKGIQYDPALLKLLYKDWTKIHGAKRAYLNKSNEEFFKDGVTRQYVHDDIHRAVAYYDKPLFEVLKVDSNSANLSKNLFTKLPQSDKIKLCREELYVTALERFLIPKALRGSKLAAYRGACRLLVTSMTKGWFPEFIMLNWSELQYPDEHNFLTLFREKLYDRARNLEEAR